jgi:hypothetical protein
MPTLGTANLRHHCYNPGLSLDPLVCREKTGLDQTSSWRGDNSIACPVHVKAAALPASCVGGCIRQTRHASLFTEKVAELYDDASAIMSTGSALQWYKLPKRA